MLQVYVILGESSLIALSVCLSFDFVTNKHYA